MNPYSFSHYGLSGNQEADRLAKSGRTNLTLFRGYVKALAKRHFRQKWLDTQPVIWWPKASPVKLPTNHSLPAAQWILLSALSTVQTAWVEQPHKIQNTSGSPVLCTEKPGTASDSRDLRWRRSCWNLRNSSRQQFVYHLHQHQRFLRNAEEEGEEEEEQQQQQHQQQQQENEEEELKKKQHTEAV